MTPTAARTSVAAFALSLGLLLPLAAGAEMALDPKPARRAGQAPVPRVASAAQAAAEVDPLERLRERLAERLSSVKVQARGDGTDLRLAAPVDAPARTHGGTASGAPAVVSAAPSTATLGEPRAVASRSSVKPVAHSPAGVVATRRSGPSAPGAATHWSYGGEAGPQTWGGLKPEFAMCSNGQRQSPIDIRDGISVDLEPVRFDYQVGSFAVVDNGHTVQVNVAPGSAIELNGRRFELKQFHFHRPSEERIDGRQFEMSVHFVHADANGRLAVVGVLLAKGPAHPLVQTVWANLPLEKHSEQQARATIDPAQLLPSDSRYFTYMGSLTTPPCSEGVQWVVMRSPVTTSPEQIEVFARLYPMNARPPQSAAGRRIMQSN